MNPVLKSKVIKFAIGAVIGFLVGLFISLQSYNEIGTTIIFAILAALCGISCAVSFKKFVSSCKFVSDFGFVVGSIIPSAGWLFVAMAYVIRIALTLLIGWIFGFINAILEVYCAARHGIDLTTYRSQDNK